MDLKNLESELLKLSPQERVAIAYKLMESLDMEENIDTEALWIEEAEKRYNSIIKGKTSLKNAEYVIREAKSKYK